MENVSEMDLVQLYYMLLLNEKYGKEIQYDMDSVWNNISKYYYLDNHVYTSDKIKLGLWIKETVRYQLLDMLMCEVYSKFVNDDGLINKKDEFFVANYNEVINMMRTHTKNIDEQPKKVALPEMTKQEVVRTVKDILENIDPSGEWLEVYEKIRNECILYLNEYSREAILALEELTGIDLTNDDANACVIINEQKGYLLLNYTGTILDVVTTIHEVSHYICRYKNDFKEETPLLSEFYAIFYEMYAINYLEKKGYAKEALESIQKERSLLMKKGIDQRKDLIDYFMMFMEKGEILETDDVGYNKYYRCDKAINDLIDNPYILHDYYPYVIGSYLASKATKNMKNDKLLLPLIKHIVENIKATDPYDVFYVLGCGNNNLVRANDTLKDVKVKKKEKK